MKNKIFITALTLSIFYINNAYAITYATWNASDKGSDITLSNGNLTASNSAGSWESVRSTIGKNSGKWYWEITIDADTCTQTGIAQNSANINSYLGASSVGFMYHYNGNKYNNGSNASYGNTYTNGDIISFALDQDTGEITAYKNGVSQGTMYTGLSGSTYYAGYSTCTNGGQITTNFGQTTFTYTVPVGYCYGLSDTCYIPSEETQTIDPNIFGSSTQQYEPTLGDVSLGLAILITMFSLFMIAFIYKIITDTKKKPWRS